MAGLPGGITPWLRPRPHVIAHGTTTQLEAPPKTFGVVGTYDGDLVGLGRVVVDSTWHHWLSMNLIPLRDGAPAYYAGMQDYYRNVGTWLLTPAQRRAVLVAAVWGVVAWTPPGLISPELGVWGIGERVVDSIERTAPAGLVTELVAAALDLPSLLLSSSGHDRLATTAILGGVGLRLLPTVRRLRSAHATGIEEPLNIAEVQEQAVAGVEVGTRALEAAMGERVSILAALSDAVNERAAEGKSYRPSVRVEPWAADKAQ